MIRLEHINYSVDDKEILKDINVDLLNEFVAITGPNGGGKSTLAKLVAGILQPTSGKIYWNDTDITEYSITDRAKLGISYAFQQPVQFKGLRVHDLMQLAAGKEATLSELCDILSEVGLCARDYIDRDLDGTLSGGELKRIEIAMVLARGTEYSIFDEPEAGIDLWSFQNLTQVFENLQKRLHGGILVISHQERILDISDKILYLKEGKIEAFDEREKVLPLLTGNTSHEQCPVIEKMNGGGKKC